MKKQILLLVVLTMTNLPAKARGGDAALGVVGGLAVGTMIGQASASESRRSSRAEQEAIRAQDKAEQVRIDQERQRITQLEKDLERRERTQVAQLEKELERRELAQKFAESKGAHSNMFMLMMMFIVLLLFTVLGLSYVIFKKKP